MDHFSVETATSWMRVVTLSYVDGEVDDAARQLVLNVCDEHGQRWVRIGMDFTAASEVMVWLNTNIHRVMTHPDDSSRLAELESAMMAPAAPAPAVRPAPQLRVKCWACSLEGQFLAMPDTSVPRGTPSCVNHRGTGARSLPLFTQLQLAMLKLVDMRRGLSTSEYANHGPASWTVRGTGNVLYRLERAGMVEADRRARPRRWHLTQQGALVAPYIMDPTQI